MTPYSDTIAILPHGTVHTIRQAGIAQPHGNTDNTLLPAGRWNNLAVCLALLELIHQALAV